MKRFGILLLVFFLVIGSLCFAGNDNILGKWYADVKNPNKENVEFLKDGTVIWVFKNESAVGNYKFVDDSRIRIDLPGPQGPMSQVHKVEISDGELKLTDTNGITGVFVKGKPR